MTTVDRITQKEHVLKLMFLEKYMLEDINIDNEILNRPISRLEKEINFNKKSLEHDREIHKIESLQKIKSWKNIIWESLKLSSKLIKLN